MDPFEQALDRLFERNSFEVCARTVKLLSTCVGNVMSNPHEAKFRSMPVAKLEPKLAIAEGGVELLLLAGFEQNSTHFTITPAIETGEKLAKAHTALLARLEPVEAVAAAERASGHSNNPPSTSSSSSSSKSGSSSSSSSKSSSSSSKSGSSGSGGSGGSNSGSNSGSTGGVSRGVVGGSVGGSHGGSRGLAGGRSESARAYQNGTKMGSSEGKEKSGDKCQRCGGPHKFIKCPERLQDMQIIGQIQTTKATLANPETKPAPTKINAPGLLDSFFKTPSSSTEAKPKVAGKLGAPLLGDSQFEEEGVSSRRRQGSDEEEEDTDYHALPKDTLRQRKTKG